MEDSNVSYIKRYVPVSVKDVVRITVYQNAKVKSAVCTALKCQRVQADKVILW